MEELKTFLGDLANAMKSVRKTATLIEKAAQSGLKLVEKCPKVAHQILTEGIKNLNIEDPDEECKLEELQPYGKEEMKPFLANGFVETAPVPDCMNMPWDDIIRYMSQKEYSYVRHVIIPDLLFAEPFFSKYSAITK